jgi:hypothetical protein
MVERVTQQGLLNDLALCDARRFDNLAKQKSPSLNLSLWLRRRFWQKCLRPRDAAARRIEI